MLVSWQNRNIIEYKEFGLLPAGLFYLVLWNYLKQLETDELEGDEETEKQQDIYVYGGMKIQSWN